MLAAIDLLSHRNGKLNIGFENGTEENAKADGNIRGTFGNPRSVAKGRNFLGLTRGEINAILEKYPVDDADARSDRAERVNRTKDAATRAARTIDTEDTD